MVRLISFLLLLLPFCHAAFSDFFGPLDAQIGDLPYQLRGEWRNTGVKQLGRKSGAVELHKYSDEDPELTRFDVRIFDASLSYLEADYQGINRFWRIYLGYPENGMSSVSFSGYGTVDRLKRKLVAVHKDAPLKEAYQIIKPRGMTFERFSNLSFHSRNQGRYYSEYSSGYGDRRSSCSFELHLKLKQLPSIERYENRFQGEGTLESKKCQTKLLITFGDSNTSTNFLSSANSLGIIACILNFIQLVALCVQVLHGWGTKTMSNVSVPTVVMLLLLTMHTTTAFAVFTDVVYYVRASFIAAAIPSGLCAGAYAGWLVMVWVMQRQKSIKVSIVESVILLSATAVTFCLSYLAMRFIPGALALFSVALYAFFVPQIAHNRKSGRGPRAIHPLFAASAVIVNMFTPVYVFLLAPSFLNMQARPIFALSLATFLIAQAIFLTLQYIRQTAPIPSGYSTIDSAEPSETASLVAGRQIKSM